MTNPEPLEIEAKFTVPDEATLAALAAVRALGAYVVTPEDTVELQRNTYFDTADMRLAAQRCGLRVRDLGDRRVATLKDGGRARGGVHERGEWEVAIGADDRPETWPPSEARDRALALTGGAPLRPIVTVRTRRMRRYALRGTARVAELSLDDGTIAAAGRELPFLELEVELLPPGTRADLDALAALLRERFALQPEDRSKLARGLELLGVER
jgi:inorganic triphosphatase YgiF